MAGDRRLQRGRLRARRGPRRLGAAGPLLRGGPLALERLHALGGQDAPSSTGARILYRFPEPDLQGKSALLLAPLELLDRLARLIPAPRIHRRWAQLLARI